MDNTMNVAKTIRAQIGRGLVMMGAKDLVASSDDSPTPGLTFRIGRNPKGATHVRIDLASDDTYTVTVLRVSRSYQVRELSRSAGVYADGLTVTLEEATGLALSLGGRS